jgi:DNA-binding MarR family transcriptional regulator
MDQGFESPEQEAFLSVIVTADALLAELSDVLKPRELSAPLYNVLRILRGAGREGLPCKEIGARLVTRVPDVTRLTDRLLSMGLAERQRAKDDRRVVRVSITKAGKEILAGLDDAVSALHQKRFGLLSRKKLGKLLGTLQLVREA